MCLGLEVVFRRMTGLQILALADDFTGAMEVGAKFAAEGLAALVSTRPCLHRQYSGIQVLVIDTETRHCGPSEAERVIHDLAASARDRGIRYIFKKTDSTLRGNIGWELRGLATAFPGSSIYFVPAYPQMGRTVTQGRLLVDGIPVSQSSFAHDHLNPIVESHIPTLLSPVPIPLPVLSITPDELKPRMTSALYILNGECEADVRTSAMALLESSSTFLSAGPAGFAQYFAQCVDLPRSVQSGYPVIDNCLVVNGSRHPNSLEQESHALEAGWPLSNPDGVLFDNGASYWTILKHPEECASKTGNWVRVTASIVCSILRRAPLDAVVVFGGDTAYGIVSALGCPEVHPGGEVLPGIPFGRIVSGSLLGAIPRRERDLYLITKAGGFGSHDVLSLIRARIARA